LSDDELRHLCKLGTVYAGFLLSDSIDEIRDADDREWADTRNCLQIVAKALVELTRRQGMQPTFRVSARREP
jgi:hypothetical protein